MSDKRKIGVLGGTFDPVHLGHLKLALDSVKAAGLDEVLLIPARIQPFKQDVKTASCEDRWKMLELATESVPKLRASRVEIDSEGVSYTYLTLRRLKAENSMSELYFITGTDSFLKIETWMNGVELLRNYSFIVGTRPGYKHDELESCIDNIRGNYGTKIINIEGIQLDVSATEIRNHLQKGESISDLVTPEVEEYIIKNGLYT